MCATCGCADHVEAGVTVLHAHGDPEHASTPTHPHAHAHDDAHPHPHSHPHLHGSAHAHAHPRAQAEPAHAHGAPETRTLRLEQDVLARNDRSAERNRGWLAARGIAALNLMSSPGAGKTTLLERSIRDLGSELEISVIEGDQATLRDAEPAPLAAAWRRSTPGAAVISKRR